MCIIRRKHKTIHFEQSDARIQQSHGFNNKSHHFIIFTQTKLSNITQPNPKSLPVSFMSVVSLHFCNADMSNVPHSYFPLIYSVFHSAMRKQTFMTQHELCSSSNVPGNVTENVYLQTARFVRSHSWSRHARSAVLSDTSTVQIMCFPLGFVVLYNSQSK